MKSIIVIKLSSLSKSTHFSQTFSIVFWNFNEINLFLLYPKKYNSLVINSYICGKFEKRFHCLTISFSSQLQQQLKLCHRSLVCKYYFSLPLQKKSAKRKKIFNSVSCFAVDAQWYIQTQALEITLLL